MTKERCFCVRPDPSVETMSTLEFDLDKGENYHTMQGEIFHAIHIHTQSYIYDQRSDSRGYSEIPSISILLGKQRG